MVPGLFGFCVDDHLWFECCGILQCACMKEMQIRSLGSFLQHRVPAVGTKTTADRIATVRGLRIETDIAFNDGFFDGYGELRRVARA